MMFDWLQNRTCHVGLLWSGDEELRGGEPRLFSSHVDHMDGFVNEAPLVFLQLYFEPGCQECNPAFLKRESTRSKDTSRYNHANTDVHSPI